jgi:hypothetical protein
MVFWLLHLWIDLAYLLWYVVIIMIFIIRKQISIDADNKSNTNNSQGDVTRQSLPFGHLMNTFLSLVIDVAPKIEFYLCLIVSMYVNGYEWISG